MKKVHFRYLLIVALLATAALVGCGGGGGGGGGVVVDPGLTIPTSNQFALPALYSSESGAFPTIGPNVELTLNNFTNTSEALMVFVNMSGSTQQLTWNVDKLSAAANMRGNEVLKKSLVDNSGPVSPEHSFHLMLRHQAQRQRRFGQTPVTLRASTRAVAVGEKQSFTVYVSDSQTESITAVCKKTGLLAGTDKNYHIFVDENSANQAKINYVVDQLANNWSGDGKIYAKNRQIFGEEPTGVLDNGVDATDFYIVVSPKVFTAGYFFTGDLNLTTVTPTSNQKKIFFLQLDTIGTDDESNRMVDTLSATMAHEFQHMIHFWQRGSNSDIWLEEAMSGYAEYANGYRIETRNNQSKALQVNLYFDRVSDTRLDVWHSSSDSDLVVNAHYGKVFLFGIWLAQNYGSSGSMAALLKNKTTDVAAIEAFTGKSFGELYSKFMLALILNNPVVDNDGYGIDGLSLTSSYDFDYSLKSVQLTGPAVDTVGATVESLARPTIAARAAVYVKVTSGDGSDVWLAANLPAGTALYQLRKD